MDLLVIRHGAARDRGEFAQTGLSDDLRPLTAEGADEMRKVARGLRTQVKRIDFLATSPLVRAVQTAEIVAEAFGIEVSDTTTALIPEARLEEFEKWCAGVGPKKVIAVVGHEPGLSFLGAFLSGRPSFPPLRKAQITLVEDGQPRPPIGLALPVPVLPEECR